jgi:MoxR-like ATPase
MSHWLSDSNAIEALNTASTRRYRVLFNDPSGTGRTLAATLLAGRSGQPLCRGKRSKVVCKHIVRTVQNIVGR